MASRLTAAIHARQVRLAVEVGRGAERAARIVRRAAREVGRVLNAGHTAAARQVLDRLPVLVRNAIADLLIDQAVDHRRRTARDLLRTLPRWAVRRMLSRRWRAPAVIPLWTPEADDDGPEIDTFALLFPAPDAGWVDSIVYSSGWQTRIASALAPASALASAIAGGMALGRTREEIVQDLLPVVQGVEHVARRIARTEGMRVAQAVQMATHAELGDLVIGYQIHALLDERTRPEHRKRNGTIYYAHPTGDQLGYDSMPNPPHEADGSLAWNCRCYLTPVLRDQEF